MQQNAGSKPYKLNDTSLKSLDTLMTDYFILNNQLEDSVEQQIQSIKKKQVDYIHVSHFDELSVKNLFKDFKNDDAFTMYF